MTFTLILQIFKGYSNKTNKQLKRGFLDFEVTLYTAILR